MFYKKRTARCFLHLLCTRDHEVFKSWGVSVVELESCMNCVASKLRFVDKSVKNSPVSV